MTVVWGWVVVVEVALMVAAEVDPDAAEIQSAVLASGARPPPVALVVTAEVAPDAAVV